jgi:hypothetical protein
VEFIPRSPFLFVCGGCESKRRYEHRESLVHKNATTAFLHTREVRARRVERKMREINPVAEFISSILNNKQRAATSKLKYFGEFLRISKLCYFLLLPCYTLLFH